MAGAQGNAGAEGLSNRVFDTKLAKGPQTYDGTRKQWRHWHNKLLGYIAGVNGDLLSAMKLAAVNIEAIVHDGMTAEHVRLSNTLYGLLNGLLEGEAYDMFLNTPPGHGYEAWRKLCRFHMPESKGHARSKLMRILEPTDIKGHFMHRMDTWEQRVREYASEGHDPPAEEIKVAILHHYLAPEEVRQHLLLSAARLSTYSTMKVEITLWVIANEGEQSTPMDVGAIDYPGKGGKGKKGGGKDSKGKKSGKDGQKGGKSGKGGGWGRQRIWRRLSADEGRRQGSAARRLLPGRLLRGLLLVVRALGPQAFVVLVRDGGTLREDRKRKVPGQGPGGRQSGRWKRGPPGRRSPADVSRDGRASDPCSRHGGPMGRRRREPVGNEPGLRGG